MLLFNPERIRYMKIKNCLKSEVHYYRINPSIEKPNAMRFLVETRLVFTNGGNSLSIKKIESHFLIPRLYTIFHFFKFNFPLLFNQQSKGCQNKKMLERPSPKCVISSTIR